jgi:hypothetical protein
MDEEEEDEDARLSSHRIRELRATCAGLTV